MIPAPPRVITETSKNDPQRVDSGPNHTKVHSPVWPGCCRVIKLRGFFPRNRFKCMSM